MRFKSFESFFIHLKKIYIFNGKKWSLNGGLRKFIGGNAEKVNLFCKINSIFIYLHFH